MSSVNSGIALLTDKVAHNGWQGFLVLIEALKAVGDDKSAKTACGLLYKLVKRERGSFNFGSPFRFECDGNCNRFWPDDRQRLFICRDCADVQFGSCCFSKRGEISRSNLVCGDKHTFLEFSEEDATNSTRDQTSVWHDGKIMEHKAWIELLRKQYLNSHPMPSK